MGRLDKMKFAIVWCHLVAASDYSKWLDRGYNFNRNFSPRDFSDAPTFDELETIGKASCRAFYTDRAVPEESIFNDFVTNGGQGAIFRCWTDVSDIQPNETANKVYFYPETMNLTQIELINTAVNNTGVRPTLYQFHDNGYIEEWLGDYEDFNSGKADLELWEVGDLVAKSLSLVHSTDVDGIPHDSHLGFTWWNTRNIKSHFYILEQLSTEERWNRAIGWFNWDRAELDSNIEWLHNLIQDNHQRREQVHLCHNDPHGGNMMLKRGDKTGETYKLIDYDNTLYGYRAFDWSYYFIHQTIRRCYLDNECKFVDKDYIDSFLLIYLENYSGWDVNTVTLSQLRKELDIMTPYVLLEQQFMWAGQINICQFFKPLLCEYERFQRLYEYERPIDCNSLSYFGDEDFDYAPDWDWKPVFHKNSTENKSAASILSILALFTVLL